jgi:ribonuclease J
MTRDVRLIPLGGLGEIGKNLMIVETANDTIAVDCGLSFPEDDMPGIDLVIPDVSYLIERKERLRGIVLTHGHEDHVGALPFVLKDINVPVYGTRLTLGLARRKLDENFEGEVDFRVFEPGDVIDFGSIQRGTLSRDPLGFRLCRTHIAHSCRNHHTYRRLQT